MHPELSWRHCSGSPPAVRERSALKGEDNSCVQSDVSVLYSLGAAPWAPRCIVTHNDCIMAR